jgi:hypothetical protein
VLILSDGAPTFPGNERVAARAALEAAQAARERGVAIHTFALGLEEIGEDDVFARMAAATGGAHLNVENPGEIVYDLPRLRLAQTAAIEIANATTGEAVRALRTAADGSFDGYLALVPGENRIRVVARGERGGRAELERVVRFEAREPLDAQEAERFAAEREAFTAALELRTLEARLALEIEQARAQRKQLRVGVEDEEP